MRSSLKIRYIFNALSVQITLAGQNIADGYGATKKEAEESASKVAIEKLRQICHTILVGEPKFL